MSHFGPVTDNPQRSRFEMVVGDQVAIAAYQLQAGQIIFTHVETPPGLRGRGVASALARGALAAARERDLEVVAHCPFMVAYIRRHPHEAGV